MEGFLSIRMRPWLRRLVTRAMAIVPAVIVAALYGEQGTGQLLILSQVILSLQLSFAVIPLVQFTSEKAKMGVFTNSALDEGAGLDHRHRDCSLKRLLAVPDAQGLNNSAQMSESKAAQSRRF